MVICKTSADRGTAEDQTKCKFVHNWVRNLMACLLHQHFLLLPEHKEHIQSNFWQLHCEVSRNWDYFLFGIWQNQRISIPKRSYSTLQFIHPPLKSFSRQEPSIKCTIPSCWKYQKV